MFVLDTNVASELMRPVLTHAAKEEVRIGALIEALSDEFGFTPIESIAMGHPHS